MYKIGDFSNMSKTTIKTLRYYEKEGLLKPVYIDLNTGYRYYETSQLVELSKIMHLRQAGLSIKDIKNILGGQDLTEILKNRKKEIEKQLFNYNTELSKINYLLEGNMKNEIFVKEIPSYIVYYRDGIISDFSKITEFVLKTGEECAKTKINEQLASGANECMKVKYSYQEIEKMLSLYGFKIYEYLNDSDITNEFFYNYNTLNPNNKIIAPKGVYYCLAVKI